MQSRSHVIGLYTEMLHHSGAIFHADLHPVFLSTLKLTHPGLAVSSLVIVLLVYRLLAGLGHYKLAISLLLHLTILKSKFVDDDGFALVRQPSPLPVDVFIVSVADNLTVWQFDLTGGEQLCLLDVEVVEGFFTCLALAFTVDDVL